MPRTVHLEWEGREYEYNPKSADWYWVLGIVAVAFAIAAALFGNYLFALLIIVAATAVALHAAKEPHVHQFRLTDAGLMIGDDFHPFSRMESFTVFEAIDGELPPLLSIKTESVWHPHLEIPLDPGTEDAVYAYFLQNVDEAEHRPTFVDVVSAWLGF